MQTQASVYTLEAYNGLVDLVNFSPHGQRLASGLYKKKLESRTGRLDYLSHLTLWGLSGLDIWVSQ
jgi:hypothetical protein